MTMMTPEPGTTSVLDRPPPCGAGIDVHGFHVGCAKDAGHGGWHGGRTEEQGDGVELTLEAVWR